MIENQNDFRSKKINETENVEKRRKIDKNNLNSNVPRYTKLFQLNIIIFSVACDGRKTSFRA